MDVLFNIREAVPADAETLAEISREELGYHCDTEMISRRLEELDKRREAVFLAVADGEVIGYIHVEEYKVLYCETMANYLGVAVSSRYRRMGAGTALIKAAEDWAFSRGITMMRLNSGSTRTGAHEFYRSMGYTDDKTQLHFLKKLKVQ